jgi:hypothetical protein
MRARVDVPATNSINPIRIEDQGFAGNSQGMGWRPWRR